MKYRERNDRRIGDDLFRAVETAFHYSIIHDTDPDLLIREAFRGWHQREPRDFSRVMQRYLDRLNHERLEQPSWMCTPLPRVWQQRRWWQRRQLLPFDRILFPHDQWLPAAQTVMTDGQAAHIGRLYSERREEIDSRTR